MTMLDPRTIARMQDQANQNAAKRSGKSGTRLLDDAENNVGNSTILYPEILPPGQNFTTVKQSNPPRVLNLTADSKSGQSITVVMTAARQANLAGLPGPVTGIIEFGNGTQFTRIEFDVPIGPYVGGYTSVKSGTQPEDSGAVVQVPTGIVRSYFRYDDAYITPTLQGIPTGSPSPTLQAPSYVDVSIPGNIAPSPLVVKAFANYFGRHHTKLYKTLYLFRDPTPSTVIQVYALPPFAKSIQVVRVPDTDPMSLTLSDFVGGSEIYPIAAGPSPIIPVTGNQSIFFLDTGIHVLNFVKVVCEIGF
jgi:hypothetical protein